MAVAACSDPVLGPAPDCALGSGRRRASDLRPTPSAARSGLLHASEIIPFGRNDPKSDWLGDGR